MKLQEIVANLLWKKRSSHSRIYRTGEDAHRIETIDDVISRLQWMDIGFYSGKANGMGTLVVLLEKLKSIDWDPIYQELPDDERDLVDTQVLAFLEQYDDHLPQAIKALNDNSQNAPHAPHLLSK